MISRATFQIVIGLVVALGVPTSALAWGASGHRMIGEAAIQSLPPELPTFLRTAKAAQDVGELSRELDRSKGAGRLHDQNLDPSHFIDVADDGTILGGPKFANLPSTRSDYEKALQAAGTDGWKAGWLPYSIIETHQQLAKDLAYWRVLSFAERREKAKPRKAWLTADRLRREALILETLGRLSHYVGDGSQPLHVTLHFNGWGDFPNPMGYTTARIHGPVEGDFVFANVKLPAVRAAMPAPDPVRGLLDQRVIAYLSKTNQQVEPLYALEKQGGFVGADKRGIAFVTRQLGAGAGELRDLIVEAWSASSRQNVGWPAVTVSDVEAGKVDPYLALVGKD
jgi:hypothetical protein